MYLKLVNSFAFLSNETLAFILNPSCSAVNANASPNTVFASWFLLRGCPFLESYIMFKSCFILIYPIPRFGLGNLLYASLKFLSERIDGSFLTILLSAESLLSLEFVRRKVSLYKAIYIFPFSSSIIVDPKASPFVKDSLLSLLRVFSISAFAFFVSASVKAIYVVCLSSLRPRVILKLSSKSGARSSS